MRAHYIWQCVHSCNQFCREDVLLLPDENKTYHLKDVFLKFAVINMLISMYKHSFGDVYRGRVLYLGTRQCTCTLDMGCRLPSQYLQCSARKVERETVCWKVVVRLRGDYVRKGTPTVPMVNALRPAGK